MPQQKSCEGRNCSFGQTSGGKRSCLHLRDVWSPVAGKYPRVRERPRARRNPQPGIRIGVSVREPNKFFHDFIGLTDDQIRAIRDGKAVAKVLESPTPDEVFVFGSVYIDSTPGRYLALASDIDALRRLPGYLAIRKFSDPPQPAD